MSKKEEKIEMPKKHTDLVGTKRIFSGGLFSSNRDEPEAEYDILKWRWGSASICDMKTMKLKHPTIEYLIKKEGMKRSRWTRGFPVIEIELIDEH